MPDFWMMQGIRLWKLSLSYIHKIQRGAIESNIAFDSKSHWCFTLILQRIAILPDEIQRNHWPMMQILFTCIAYFELEKKSFAFMSGDIKHDTANSLFALQLVKNTISSFWPLKISQK